MEKVVRIAYGVVAVAMAALLLYYLILYRDRVDTTPIKMGCHQLSEKELSALGEGKVEGTPWTGTFLVDGVVGKYCHLMFYTIHQNVEVYVNNELIYSMAPSPKNAFAKTPGCVWNDILLKETYNGQRMTIILTPVYTDLAYGLPKFFIGEKGGIVIEALKEELLAVIVSLCLMGIGICMGGYMLYNRKNSEVDKDLIFLGAVAILVGLWRISDSKLSKLMFHGLPIFSLVPFMAMLLVVVPFVFFMMGLYNSKGRKVWFLPCIISLAVTYISMLLQYFNVRDFRQTLLYSQLTIILAIFIVILMACYEFWRNGLSMKLRDNLLGMTVVVIGVLIDVLTYYISDGTKVTSFVILGFLIYGIALSVSVFRESGDLITAGKGAQSMETLAYHDKLTGLFNRAAFNMDTDPYAVNPENYVVAVLDLNNLKKCNDQLGHEMGDKYIVDSAEIIRNTFGTIGNCYRMGGDEFYCLIPKGGKASCREQQENMERMVEEYNAKSDLVKISIACGFARFDIRIDYDLNSTAKRADQLMYQNKEEMKKHKGETA
ncbi:MAG: diguanylate cyclase [Lachnospiraceae bacterium]|nr:diguanylate cyclase [Lachnospiraceae bacterium]